MGLHLVQTRPENDNYPMVLASPSDGHVRTKNEIGPDEILDFDYIVHEGQLPWPKYKKWRAPFKEADRKLPKAMLLAKANRRAEHFEA